eukprot:SAG31_NODE_4033_length_3648_cov_1.803043_3_plen_89_part_00
MKLSNTNLDNYQAAAALDLLLPPPDDFGRVLYVKGLYMDGNKLTRLTPTLGDLADLQTLNLAYNLLVELPDALTCLTHLKTLMVNNNR